MKLGHRLVLVVTDQLSELVFSVRLNAFLDDLVCAYAVSAYVLIENGRSLVTKFFDAFHAMLRGCFRIASSMVKTERKKMEVTRFTISKSANTLTSTSSTCVSAAGSEL